MGLFVKVFPFGKGKAVDIRCFSLYTVIMVEGGKWYA